MSRLDRHVALVQNKLTLAKLLTALAWSLLVFGALVWIAILVQRIFAVALPRQMIWFWCGLGVSVISAAVYAFLHRPSRHQAAVAIDEKLALKEKFSTALYVRPSTDPFAAAAVKDAERTADQVNLHNQFPLRVPPRPAAGTVAVALVAFLTAWLLPTMDLFGRQERLRLAALQEQQKQQIEKDVKKALAVIEQAPQAVKDDQQIKAAKAELQNLLARPIREPSKARSTALRALQDVDSIRQKIKDTKNFAEAQNQFKAWKTAMQPIDESGPVGKAQSHMAKGEFTEAINELSAAVKNFDKMSEPEKEKAAQQMQNMANQLQQMANDPKQQQQMQQQLQKMGASQQQAQQMVKQMQQAANGDKQAQQQLQQQANKMMQQMNNGQGPNQQQQQQIQQMMQQMQAQAAAQQQAQQMQQAAQQMAQAMQAQAQAGQQQGQQGQQGQGKQGGQQGNAGQQMANAQQQMQQQLQQMQAAQQAAQAAQAGMANAGGGNNGGQQPGQGQGQVQWGQGNAQWGQGNPQQKGQGMGGPGIGAGGKAEVAEAPYQVQQEVTTGHVHEDGKILASQLVKAAAVKGESKIDISQAAASELKDATDEIDQDRIPRAAQKAVRQYFGNGDEGEAAPE